MVTSECVGIYWRRGDGGEMPQNLERYTLNILMPQTEKTWYTEREKGTTEKKALWGQRYTCTCTNTPTTDSVSKMIINIQNIGNNELKCMTFT